MSVELISKLVEEMLENGIIFLYIFRETLLYMFV